MADGPAAAGVRIGEFFEDHGRMVYGLCRMLLRDPTEAEDAAQETFVAAYRALLRGGGPRDPAAWLAAIARNVCRARVRALRRESVAAVEPDLAGAEGPDALVERRLWLTELARALGELPERQREALVLRDLYGLRTREVGSALGLSRPAVESLVFRARRRLRVRLRPVAGALALPLALREGLAQALPGFASGAGGAAGATGAAASGAVLVAKLAAGTAAVGAATSVALVEADRAGPPPTAPRPRVVAPAAARPPAPEPAAVAPTPPTAPAPATGDRGRDEVQRGQAGPSRSGPAGVAEDRDEDEDDAPDVARAHPASTRSGPAGVAEDRDEDEDDAPDATRSGSSGTVERGVEPEALELEHERSDRGSSEPSVDEDIEPVSVEGPDDSGSGSSGSSGGNPDSSGPGGGESDEED